MIDRAAIKDPSGKVWSVPRPGRHSNVIRHMVDNGYPPPVKSDCEQGFLTNEGEFVNRFQAGSIAFDAGQIGFLKWPPELYSEDVW